MSYDPRLAHNTLWTSHTIAGGAGSQVRWYEINPKTDTIDQTGTVSDPNLFIYNSSISSDRIVRSYTKKFGDSAVISFNTSSTNSYTAIQMESIVSGQTASNMTLVKQSAGSNVDFSCYEPYQPYCRWGDYSGAVPDPSASTLGLHGQVLLVNQWNLPNIDDSTPVWQTIIWQTKII
jgi:hypothetical protein